MLQSVLSNADQLKKFADEFVDKTLQRSLLDVNIELLKQVVSVLEHFEAATQLLSTDRSPSLHLVYATKVQLNKKLRTQNGDGLIIGQLKARLMSRLETNFHVQPQHWLATLLDPRLKTGILGAQQKLDAVSALRALLAEVEYSSHDTADSDASDSASTLASCEPPAKRSKLEMEQAACCLFHSLQQQHGDG